MASNTWTLTDVDQDCYVEELQLTPKEVGGTAAGYSVTKRRLHGGLRDGVDVIEVDNGSFRFVVIPTRGMGLWRAALGNVSLGWRSPVKGPVHPAFVHSSEGSGLGWLDGFDELLVRCGLESNGAPEFNPNGSVRYGLHGKIANVPAHKTEVTIDGDSGEITVSGVVDEARLFNNKLRLAAKYVTTPGQPGLRIVDTVTNLSAEPGELELLYHANFGVPLVGEGAKLVVPVAKMAPRDAIAAENVPEWDTYGPETPGAIEACFYFRLAADARGRTQAVLHSASADRGVTLRFNVNQLPCFTQWKNRQAAEDGYVTGLEPAINFPNARSFEKQHGRVAVLEPGESRTFELELIVHATADAVAAAKREVAALQQGTTPEVLAKPDPDWAG
jgi:galactose mutarotase-like enzyme